MNQAAHHPVRSTQELDGIQYSHMFALGPRLFTASPCGDLFHTHAGNVRWTVLLHSPLLEGRKYFACCTGGGRAYFQGGFSEETREYRGDLVQLAGTEMRPVSWGAWLPLREHAMGCIEFHGEPVLVLFGGYHFGPRGPYVSAETFLYYTRSGRLEALVPEDAPERPFDLGEPEHGQTQPPGSAGCLRVRSPVADNVAAPCARYGHSIVAVDGGARLLMFGGHDGMGPLNDLWEMTVAYAEGRPPLFHWTRVDAHLSVSEAPPGGSHATSGPAAAPGALSASTLYPSGDEGPAPSQKGRAGRISRTYDVHAETWYEREFGAPSPQFFGIDPATPPPMHHHAAVAVGNAMIVVSGIGNASGAFWVYDLSQNMWLPSRVRFPLTAFGAPVAVLQGRLHYPTFYIELSDILLYGGGSALDVCEPPPR